MYRNLRYFKQWLNINAFEYQMANQLIIISDI